MTRFTKKNEFELESNEMCTHHWFLSQCEGRKLQKLVTVLQITKHQNTEL